jgi:site-specific DNA-methyltransferase (adenine-specific)
MTYQILHGNNLDMLPTLADNSIDSIVTDPPYELGFMGKKWDSTGIAYSVELWEQCLRVLKPGGHLLAFSGSRTYHRMVVAIEDAGFEIRDMVSWISNKTFPKSLNIGKAIDKIAKADTKQWHGWGTGLKPTVEPIVMARKPVEGTVANNVLTHGTGGLNIDASRIAASDQEQLSKFWDRNQSESKEGSVGYVAQTNIDLRDYKPVDGRWPANLIIDPYTAELLDEQSGQLKPATSRTKAKSRAMFGTGLDDTAIYLDKGGASRFFYVAKASKRDRNEGLDELEESIAGSYSGNVTNKGNKIGAQPDKPNQPAKNFHPTVKPTSLMEYLIKLVTPPNGTVLDPFTGSGSTGKAAILQGFDFIGIEMTEGYLPIIEGRLKHAEAKVAERIKETADQEQEKLF